jgi:N-methylhydantoinase B/oxoprolinase/acetone carboxylase alpha subunit
MPTKIRLFIKSYCPWCNKAMRWPGGRGGNGFEFSIGALTCSHMKKTSQRRSFDYPVTTKGGETAAKVRAEANRLSESERETLFKKGMQMIYGES